CSQRYRSAFGHSAQSEGLETEVVGDRDDVFDTGFQGVVNEVAAGEAAAALVHLDPQNPLRVGVDSEHLQESRVEVQVADPAGNPDERHALALDGVGDADAVSGGYVADFALDGPCYPLAPRIARTRRLMQVPASYRADCGDSRSSFG